MMTSICAVLCLCNCLHNTLPHGEQRGNFSSREGSLWELSLSYKTENERHYLNTSSPPATNTDTHALPLRKQRCEITEFPGRLQGSGGIPKCSKHVLTCCLRSVAAAGLPFTAPRAAAQAAQRDTKRLFKGS